MESETEPGSRLCERLDWQLLRYLQEMEQLRERQERLERLMEQGWFSLSKARYSMGSKWVSSLQYGPEMVPLAQVDVSLKEDGRHSFKVERVVPGEVKRTEAGREERKEIMEIGAKDQVRRRKARWRGEEERKLLPEDELADRMQALKESPREEGKPAGQGDGPLPGQDPLKWFGILVPQSLRLAQTSFKEVMEVAAEVATLQSSLVSTKAEYRALLQQKQKLIGHQSK
ncbi:coiled-coil domain-containing protein 115 [Heterodontus francisci]|uniref:coiled-coil domain-containing protein 115 n=1 Tax=Heterodontus francisci TaxID=7792 RepID=UPI00355BF665